MFFLQLRQLIWKNYLVRKRSKIRVAAELIWPLTLFIILALVRTNGLKSYQKECFLQEKALPSAGPAKFYQSLFCSSYNFCYNELPNSSALPDFNYEEMKILIAEAEKIALKSTVSDNEKILEFLSSLHTTNPLLHHFENMTDTNLIKNFIDSQSLEMLLNQAQFTFDFREEKLIRSHDFSSETRLNLISQYILNGFQKLDLFSLGEVIEKISKTEVGTFAQLWNLRDTTLNSSIVIPLLTRFCGYNPVPLSLPWDTLPHTSRRQDDERSKFYKIIKEEKANLKSNLSDTCKDFFSNIQENTVLRPIFQNLYPFIRGKLVYAPNTAAFNRVIENVNKTFQDLRNVQNVTNNWLNDISPRITELLYRLEGAIENATNSINSTIPGHENITSILNNATYLIQRLELIVYSLDSLAIGVNSLIDCYEFDKFEGFGTEDEAVKRGNDLLIDGELWAVLIFSSSDPDNLTTTDLPRHISYKIRMDKFEIDGTTRLEDYVEIPLPRNDPREGQMKYFTSGFIFLQDRIEQAIIKIQTNQDQLPEMYMNQIPGPCIMFDTFLFSLAPSFTLFMNLAFVFSCAMIVKSIVYEKERRLKETMRTMGLGNAVHWVAWFIDSMFILLLVCIILPLILVYGKITENSDPTVLIVFLLSFNIANVCFSFLISTLFSKANLSAACGAFIYFICYQPFALLDLGNQSYSMGINILACLLSNIGFAIGNTYLFTFEELGVGVQWNNIASSPTEDDPFSLLAVILMLLADSVIYLTLTWYIETVFPGQYGIPKAWYFFVQPSYWCNNEKETFQDICEMPTGSELIEEESRALQAGVSIRNLNKTYSNGKVAVTNLNLDFYKDQITSFLGHNGAGKTTTISILTGLFPPSSGTATINGLDIRYQMDGIRKQLGLCPQHNVLFDQLTVEEHLRFYANLKSGQQIKSRKEIDKMIEDLGLMHKRDDISEQLSGGMKRKLSIGAAFIGNSKTVILDEPTAGVDPYSRRAIWDILLKYKAGRTIILTTHFMDEADILGDRIAIISQGQLKCCGSSLFLKQKLGSGYYLTLVRKEDVDNQISDTENHTQITQENEIQSSSTQTQLQSIDNVLKRHIPNAQIVQDVGSDITVCLPEFNAEGNSQRSNFPALFHELESSMTQLNLDSYGVSDTTLEEIFLKVADDPSDSNLSPKHETNLDESQSQSTETENGSENFNLTLLEKITGRALVMQHFLALYVKRYCNSKRNLKGFACEIILPVLLVVIGELFSMTVTVYDSQPPLVLSPWLYGESNQVFYANRNPSGTWNNEFISNMLNGTGMGTRCLIGEPIGLNCSIDDIGLLNPLADTTNYQDLACPCDDLSIPNCPADEGELWKFGSVSSDEFYDLSKNNIPLWILRTFEEQKHSRFGGFEFGIHNNASVNVPMLSQFNQLSKKHKNAFITDGNYDSNIKVWFNNKAYASSVSYLNAINNVILRSFLQKDINSTTGSVEEYGITAINHPLEFSNQHNSQDLVQVGISVAFALTLIFSMSFVPASFVIFLVEERVSKAKHLQFVSGVKPLTFWIAQYTWDIVNYTIPSILVILVFLAFGQWEYVGSTSIGGMILLLMFFGISAIPLMYPASFIFSVPSTAFVGLACINLFIGVVTTVTSFTLQLFDDPYLNSVGSILGSVFLIFPHFCFGRGLIDLTQEYYTAQRYELYGIDYPRQNIMAWNYLGRYLICMLIEGIIFFVFNLLLHYNVFPENLTFKKPTLPVIQVEDEDVARERERVEQDVGSTDELRLLRLTKIYGGRSKPATDQLSFGLRKGECFGLLGVNGAGKSTTFKMLTGDETVTSGNAFVGGFSVLSNLTEAQQNLGYCPQEDALLPLLTGVEHLELFARLRGVPKRHMKRIVNDNLKKLSLLPYKNRCAGTYSGGNKRKLSTAISLIGNPSVVFLDEPSSGMDPRARRSLWGAIIDAVKDSRSVLLTSHSMEECQVLCTRLAIMVNGTLRCLGSAQHLKNRFGDGYMINVRCEVETVGEVMHCVQSAIPEAQLREKRSRQLIWHVPPNTLPISTLFEKMEAARVITPMVDYSITQTTLDDVFVRFASLQKEVEDESIEQGASQGLEASQRQVYSPKDFSEETLTAL